MPGSAGLSPRRGCVAAALPPGPALAGPGSSQSWRRLGSEASGARSAAPGKRDSCSNVPPAAAASRSRPRVPRGPRHRSSPEREPCRQPGPEPALARTLGRAAVCPDRAWLCPPALRELSRGREGGGGSCCCRDGFGPWPSKEPLPQQLRCPRALLPALWALLVAQPVPRGGKVPAGSSSGETENVLAVCNVLPAQQWCTARAHAPHCSRRCSRHRNTCSPYSQKDPKSFLLGNKLFD